MPPAAEGLQIQIETRAPGHRTLLPSGEIRMATTRSFHEAMDRLLGADDVERIDVDFSGVTGLDSSGIAALALAAHRCRDRGIEIGVSNLSDEHRKLLSMMPQKSGAPAEAPHEPVMFEWLGEYGLTGWARAEEFYDVMTDAAKAAWGVLRGRFPPKGSVSEQAVRIGVDALPIVALLSLLLGLVLAFQAADQLQDFGAAIYTADIVGIGMFREFGPILTGIVIAGRSGSGMAAELGTMAVNEEVDALRSMGIDHSRFLVLPRMLAITIVQPALTLMSDLIGSFGGLLIGTLYLKLPATGYVNQSVMAIELGDLFQGLGKSVVFAVLIGLIACYSGLTVTGGATGVGRATTRAVVASIFMIIVADSIFTTLSTILG